MVKHLSRAIVILGEAGSSPAMSNYGLEQNIIQNIILINIKSFSENGEMEDTRDFDYLSHTIGNFVWDGG